MLVVFGNIKSTDKATFHMIKFWMNMNVKEKNIVGRSWQGRLSGRLALSRGSETCAGAWGVLLPNGKCMSCGYS